MGQGPLVALRLLRRLRLRRGPQRGEELTPGEVVVRAVGEVDVGEGGDAERFFTVGFKERDEPELAIEKLDYLLSIPSLISAADLRFNPQWDPLRDDPRFQALLEKYETQLN